MANEANLGASFRRGVRRKVREFAGVRRRIKQRFGWLAPLRIALYGGYGTTSSVRIIGRVLEEAPGAPPSAADPRISNFRRAFAQFESDEVPGVELEVSAAGSAVGTVTDEDGYFQARLELTRGALPGWLPVNARVTRAPYPVTETTLAGGAVLVPSPTARFGVISDIDDTILRTHVRNKAKMLYLTLLGNALTRLSFEGTSELYQGLRRAGSDAPFFYVSHSMWNIFPLLEHFIDHHGLPRGPLLLRDLSLFRDRSEPPHKSQAIADLFATYPNLPFVLIGDSGERDLQIYLDALRAHPGRILSILIRNVSNAATIGELRDLANTASSYACPALVFDDTSQALEHCRELGLWAAADEGSESDRLTA